MNRESNDARSAGVSVNAAAVTLDLRGVRCPLNWAKAKVQLEQMQRGDVLTLLLDDPRGIRDIPRAAEASGYVVGEKRELEDHWRLRLVV